MSVDTIRKWHTDKGWDDIGYHYVIQINGDIGKGRDVADMGSHSLGENSDSIGICYIGGVEADGKTPKDTMTSEQDISVLRLVDSLRVVFGNLTLHGHNEFSNKACPSFDVREKYKFLIHDYGISNN